MLLGGNGTWHSPMDSWGPEGANARTRTSAHESDLDHGAIGAAQTEVDGDLGIEGMGSDTEDHFRPVDFSVRLSVVLETVGTRLHTVW